MIYFDNAATTPVLPCAWDAMHAAPEGNPSSIHAAGREAKAALEKARATIARCLNCAPCEVYFTSGATEACNWMVKCLRIESDGIIYNGTVHHAVSEGIHAYSSPNAPRGKPSAVLSLVNNETGQISDVAVFCRKTVRTASALTPPPPSATSLSTSSPSARTTWRSEATNLALPRA